MKYDNSEQPPAIIIEVEVSPLTTAAAHGGASSSSGSRKLPAKVDTGAAITVIPERLREDLKLIRRGAILAKGIFGLPQLRATYYVAIRININHATNFELPVITAECDKILLGRDILNRLKLIADGKLQEFELKDP